MTVQRKKVARPPIYLIESEADTLSDLAWNARDRFPEVSQMLLDEVGRAKICARNRLPTDVVTMFADVEYEDEGSGALRTVQLVYPNHADTAVGKISILTPIGAGLIGLKAGSSIVWPDRDGTQRALTVRSVTQRPEA